MFERSFVCCQMRRAAAVLLLALGCLSSAQATDVLIRFRIVTATRGPDYRDAVLREALRRTVPKYGKFEVRESTGQLARDRMLAEMLLGEEINTTIVATQPNWEEQLLPIRIPIDLGLTSYRIGFVREGGQDKLSAVQDFEQFKSIRFGAGTGWSSRKVMETNGLHVEVGADINALFKMLLTDRFDYLPRGIDEVFREFDERSAEFPELRIEQNLVMLQPLPTYVFVSPKAPRLAKRLEEGMESMVRDGTMQKLMLQHFADTIARANLCQRRIIRVPNPMLTADTPLDRKEIWFDPFDAKRGICRTPPRNGGKK